MLTFNRWLNKDFADNNAFPMVNVEQWIIGFIFKPHTIRMRGKGPKRYTMPYSGRIRVHSHHGRSKIVLRG